MSHHSAPNTAAKDPNPPAPLLPTTNNTSVSPSAQRYSISTAAPDSPSRTPKQRINSFPSPNGKAPVPPRSPLHRSPSSMSTGARSSTPTLLKKASMSSLHGVGGVLPSRASTSRGSPSQASPSRRSSSAQFLTTSTSQMSGKSPLSEVEDMAEALPRHTAASIATGYFEKELQLQSEDGESQQADTIVVLHDSCYGHRFSRPRTSKASLSTIVERPERIHASILGLSVAYVRLGERHAAGRHAPHPKKDVSLISTAPFRIRKTTRRLALSSQSVTNVHGTQWMEELKIMCENAEAKLAMNGKELSRPEMSRSPDSGAPAKLHEGDLYLCSESLNAMEGALGAVCEGVDAVFNGSASGKGPHRTFVAIRPPGHHCSASYPSGFCWLNNVHVGISYAALTHGLTHAAIIDFDLHHGDGSQSITWEHNSRAQNLPKNALPWKKTSIGYFSLHDINSYPCEMGDEEKVKNASLCIENAHGQSIWNVHLQPWKSEFEFWDLYETKYSILLEKTRNFLRAQTERLRSSPNLPKPKGAIFLSAGFDASEWESSGMQRHKVNVPTEFYARLTRDVVKIAAEEGSAVEGRIISVLEGGYSDRALCSGVFSHLSGLAGGEPITINKEFEHNGLAYEMGKKIGAFNGDVGSTVEPLSGATQLYDPSWWSLASLEQLDATRNPPPPDPEPKKPREPPSTTYSSPTQSFMAKANVPRTQRSVSNMSNVSSGPPSPRPVRAPSPPPPEVDWTVAAVELSKLLIPTERQTMSCKPEELSAEATRARRDRQSILTPPTSTSGSETIEAQGTRMALRVRKPAKTVFDTVEEDEAKKAPARATRRKTVAGSAALATERDTSRSSTPKPEPNYAQPTKQSARRLSLASTTGSVISEAPSSRPNNHSRVPSRESSIPLRPGSSQSIRPDSSMSSRAHSVPPVIVKKARAPSQPRAEAAKPARIRRTSPLNETAPKALGTDRPVENQPSSGPVGPLPVQSSKGAGPDVDSLTSDMKKIKISLTTKAQREAMDRTKRAAKPVSTKASTKATSNKPIQPRPSDKPTSISAPAPIKVEVTASQTISNVVADQQPLPLHLPPTPATPQPSLPAHIPNPFHEATQVPLPVSSPLGPTPGIPTPTTNLPVTSPEVFIPYQPEGLPATSVTPHEPLRWLPPNTSTPSPMKRGELPVFTSTSSIKFGTNPNLPGQTAVVDMNRDSSKAAENQQLTDSIWDVPVTPRK